MNSDKNIPYVPVKLVEFLEKRLVPRLQDIAGERELIDSQGRLYVINFLRDMEERQLAKPKRE